MGTARDDTVNELTIVSDAQPPVVQSVVVNANLTDPQDLPSGPQLTNWQKQHSDIRTIVVTFSESVVVDAADVELVNLGIDAPNDPDSPVVVTNQQLAVSGNQLVISFGPFELTNGVYELTLRDTITDQAGHALDGDSNGSPGGDWVAAGDEVSNNLYKLGGEYNGDLGVSIFDFSVFVYWFGRATEDNNGVAPSYADLNNDGGVSIFDFSAFVANFGVSVSFPVALTSRDMAFFADEDSDTENDGGAEHRRIDQELVRPVPRFIHWNGSRATHNSKDLRDRISLSDSLESVLDEIAPDVGQTRGLSPHTGSPHTGSPHTGSPRTGR